MQVEASLLFARTFLKHPIMLGSIIPSSRSLVQKVAQQIDWENTQVLVEYGPGVGTFTAEFLRRLRPDGVLIAIDYNRDLADYLGKKLRDPRLKVAHASAADVEQVLADLGLDGADCIVSGIPFSTLPPELRKEVVGGSHRVLRPGGNFIVYQFTGAVLPHLRERFGNVRQQFELLNILPARIFCCSR